MEWQRDGYTISDDPGRLDPAAIHAYLTRSYWSEGIPLATVRRALANSLCFGLFEGDAQVGFARLVTDRATFAYLCDVYVLEEHRGRGLSKWLMEVIVGYPDLQGLRRWSLVTRDAEGLYAQYGFTPLASPGSWMERWDPEVYRR